MTSQEQISSEFQSLLEGKPEDLQSKVETTHPEDLADAVGLWEDELAATFLTVISTECGAQVFERLDNDRQVQLTRLLGIEAAARLATAIRPDDRADFFDALPEELSNPLLEELRAQDPEGAAEVSALRQWHEHSAGGLMTPDFISVSPHITIKQAIAQVRDKADDAETIDTLFVTTKFSRLLGVLSLRRILLADPDDLIADVMWDNVKSVPPDMDQEAAARVLAKYDFNTLPVVTKTGRVLGVITADDILDVLTEEQSEDVHKMGAIEPIKDGYFDTGHLVFLRKRAPWLIVLFAGGVMTTQALQSFELELSTVTQLAFYLPLLISAGGNSGAQSSTLIIRGLAVGDIETQDWTRVLTRELIQGLVLGVLLAGLGVTRAIIAGDGSEFALLVGVTIVAIVVLGCVTGGMAPMLLQRVGFDPATSSTPFIATLVDVLGIVVYLQLARLLLNALYPLAAG